MNVPVYLYFECISFLASFALLFQKKVPLYLKLFIPYMAITLTVETIGYLMNKAGEDASLLYYLFTVFEFAFYFYALHCIIRTGRMKKVIFGIFISYPVLALVNIFFIQPHQFPSISYSVGCLLTVGMCIYYFYELFHLPTSANLVREAAFWICTALLFFYICSFPLFGLYKFLYTASNIIMQNISVVLYMMNVLLYTLFTTAFLCGIRRRQTGKYIS